MNFLIEKDYFHLIRKEILDVVVDTEGKRIEAETAAESEISSYLESRYDTAKLFIKHTTWNPATIYDFNDYVILTADDYDDQAIYQVDDLINFNESIYIATALTAAGEDPDTTPAKWTLLDANFTFFTALKTDDFVLGTAYSIGDFVVFEGARYEAILGTDGTQKPTNTQFWTLNTANVPAGTLPTDLVNWTKGDTRHPLAVRYMIDLTLYELHSRINPRNIPEHRIQRRDDAIAYLKMVIDPRKNITPNFPEKVRATNQDNALVWGSNVKVNHGQNSY